MIINGDCIKGMERLINKNIKVDCIITDPPYLMAYKSNMRKKSHKFSKQILNDENEYGLISKSLLLMSKLLKDDGGAIYCFCSEHNIDFFKQEIEKYFKIKNILIWCKNGGTMGDLEGAYSRATEFIIFATKGRHILNGKREKNIFFINRVPSAKQVHQNQKPLKLIKKLVLKSSNKGDTILDPFSGSGTTGVACKELYRNFIGFELDETYYKIANKRINIA